MFTRANFYVDQGTNFSTELDVFLESGLEADLTNYTFTAQARKSYSSALAFQMTIVPIDANTVSLEVYPADTATVDPGKYVYDVVIESPSGVKTKLVEGLLFLIETVSRTA